MLNFFFFLNSCFVYLAKVWSCIPNFIKTKHTTLQMGEWQFIQTNFVFHFGIESLDLHGFQLSIIFLVMYTTVRYSIMDHIVNEGITRSGVRISLSRYIQWLHKVIFQDLLLKQISMYKKTKLQSFVKSKTSITHSKSSDFLHGSCLW